MADLVGTVVSGRYELARLIGHGGQSVVYAARDHVDNRSVAVKILPFAAARNPDEAARLAREQQAMIALAGTSAVAVYDLCEAPNGALCLVMELLEGEDLERHLDELEHKNDRLSLLRLAAIAEPLVDTLERAPDAGILHRDIKPGNVFLLSDALGGGVRLLDFGLSRMSTAAPLTAAGIVLGSPSYIAPEVWKGRTEELDGRVDVYSFGVILYRALARRLPFEGDSLQEKFIAATTAPRPSLYAVRKDLTPKVDEWVERALAIDREKRYATVRQLWNGLLSALSYSPPPRAVRPVAESLVNAWRKATTAFLRFMKPEEDRVTPSMVDPGDGRRGPPPLPPSKPQGERAGSLLGLDEVDEGWLEIGDEDLLAPKAGKTPPRARAKEEKAAPPAKKKPSRAGAKKKTKKAVRSARGGGTRKKAAPRTTPRKSKKAGSGRSAGRPSEKLGHGKARAKTAKHAKARKVKRPR